MAVFRTPTYSSVIAIVSSLALVTASAAEQAVGITSLSKDGILSWTNSATNVSSTVLFATNFGTGAWLPSCHVVTTGTAATVNLPQPKPPHAFYRIRGSELSNIPTGMVYVPPGHFQMGDTYEEGRTNARPAHVVAVDAFCIETYEVTNEDMRRIMQWAYDHGLVGGDSTTVTNREGDSRELLNLDGFDDGRPFTHLSFSNGILSVVAGRANHPATGVTWYGAQAYCNYRSDMEGLPRCIAFTNRVSANISDWPCDFTKPGYRLPTEAEWEKACRGGLTGHHYPWDSYADNCSVHLTKAKANYAGVDTKPVGYYNGTHIIPGFSNVADMANGYGLYDMAGNVWEWVWDYYKADWYTLPSAIEDNTRGPNGPWTGTEWLLTRIIRGGSVGDYSSVSLTCAYRSSRGWAPSFANWVVGFRCARSF